MLTSSIIVFATTETTVILEADKNEVKVGESFSVTLKATCPDGINGIDTTYSYDTEKLELVSGNVANSKFAPLGIDNQISVISNSTESISNADIYTLTFIVKEGVKSGSTAIVSIIETLLDSNAETDSAHTIEGQEVAITIIEENKEQPPADKDKKDDTIADKKYDKAGVNTILIFIIALLITLAIIIHKKIQNIKI